MTAKETVLAVYLNASETYCGGCWEIWDSEAFEGDYAHRLGHSAKSAAEAWADAASRLDAAPASKDTRVEEIRKRLEAITKRPWTWAECKQPPNVRFIAAAPDDILYLLSLLDGKEQR